MVKISLRPTVAAGRCVRTSAGFHRLGNWEQGRARPNSQAAALILMVRKYPDTLKRLNAINDEAA